MALFSRKHAAPDLDRNEPDALRVLNRSPRAARNMREETDPEAPLDPAEAVRTRARRRLIGAAALALGAVVFVPMLFDSPPPAAPDDIAVQIPARDTPFTPQRPDQTAATAPRVPQAVTEASPPAPPSVTPSPAVPDRASVEKEAPAGAAATHTAQDKPNPHSPASAEKAPAAPAAPRVEHDDPRAIAALQGKSEKSDAARPAIEPTSSPQRFAVQIAAFSVADKAKNLRDRLNANGLKSYTEALSTPQGERTRVRLGPFTSREAAERARQKLKTMKLDGSVVPL